MFQLGRYGSRDIMDLQIFDFSTKKPIMTIDYATSTQMENTAETVYARGGRGNPRRIAWHGDKETTITVETQIFTLQHLAMLAGESIVTKSSDIYRREVKPVQEDGMGNKIVTLDKKPIGDASEVLVYAYVNGILGSEQSVLSIEDNEIILDATATVQAGDEVEVYYRWNTPTASELKFTSRGFPGYVFMVGDVLFTDELSGIDVAAQIKYYKAKLQNNFTLSFAPTGDPSTLSLVFDVFPVKINGVDTLYDITLYEHDE